MCIYCICTAMVNLDDIILFGNSFRRDISFVFKLSLKFSDTRFKKSQLPRQLGSLLPALWSERDWGVVRRKEENPLRRVRSVSGLFRKKFEIITENKQRRSVYVYGMNLLAYRYHFLDRT